MINSKLNEVDKRLKEIQQDVKDIKDFLESSERAKLFSALSELLKVNEKMPVEHSHTILHNCRSKLAEINMRYRQLLSESNTIERAIANKEYFSITALALVRCTVELGMFDIAFKEIDEMNLFWQSQARRIVREILIGEYSERFLATDFVYDVSVRELTQWLDFAFEEQKGLIWIDI